MTEDEFDAFLARHGVPERSCGHHHQEFEPVAPGDDVPIVWRVTSGTTYAGLELAPGTLVDLVLSDEILQGCLAAEDLYRWSRYQITTGVHAGRCIEVQVTNPGYDQRGPVVPAWLEPASR